MIGSLSSLEVWRQKPGALLPYIFPGTVMKFLPGSEGIFNAGDTKQCSSHERVEVKALQKRLGLLEITLILTYGFWANVDSPLRVQTKTESV